MIDKLVTILFFINAVFIYGQEPTNPYKFSEEIFHQIDRDTLAWKYQIGATECSFISRYSDVLKMREKEGLRKPKISKEDSLYFVNCNKINAKKYIVERAKNAQIVIINEAHHMSSHRTFTRSLLQDLYDNGYRYLGLEALFDTLINERKYAVIESGYYTQEPEFGNLIFEAINIGFTLFGYEAGQGKNGKEREIEQAQNIQKFIEKNPNGKVLIHCGYAHVYENEYAPWEKAMAGRLKDALKIDPLTIDQTMFLERSEMENNHIFVRLNDTHRPIVLMDKNEQAFKGFNEIKQTDIVVIHPPTQTVNGRPHWLIEGKRKNTVSLSKVDNNGPTMILAYRNDIMNTNGVPADILEVADQNASRDMYLSDGLYTIIIKDKSHQVIDKYSIEIK